MNNPHPNPNPWLHRFAMLTAVATLALVGLGGLVTSHGAGMAVPDWPTSYGYNMFALPFKFWRGGAFFEHTHRLAASGVGLLTTILALWLFGKKSRSFMRWAGFILPVIGIASEFLFPNRWLDGVLYGATGLVSYIASIFWPRCEESVKWLRSLGIVAFFAVMLQGVLGGLRVVLFKDAIGIFHAALAQLFFVLTCAIALFTSRWWQSLPAQSITLVSCGLRKLFLFTTILIFLQLVLGATMRHQHAGLAISDFPLAHGKLWPDTSAAAVAGYNALRMEMAGENPITAFQIVLQMVHRIMAVVILVFVGICAWQARNSAWPIRWFALIWLGMIFIQAALGAWTIWSDKAADVATAHVVVGALSLALGGMLCIIAGRFAK